MIRGNHYCKWRNLNANAIVIRKILKNLNNQEKSKKLIISNFKDKEEFRLHLKIKTNQRLINQKTKQVKLQKMIRN